MIIVKKEWLWVFKAQTKKELEGVYDSIKTIDDEIVKIKVAMHTLEKLLVNTDEYNKLIDELGIAFYKLKTYNKDFLEDWLDNNK